MPPRSLCSKVEPDIIRVLGRWRSDEMLRYLHLQAAAPLMQDYSRRMLADGTFTLIPNQWVPSFVVSLMRRLVVDREAASEEEGRRTTDPCTIIHDAR